MKIKLMIAAVIACLVFTGFSIENVSDTVDHNAWKTSGVVVIQNDVLTLAGSNARALLNDGKGYTNFELDMDVRTTTGGKEPDEEFRERERMVQDEYPGRRTACPGAD